MTEKSAHTPPEGILGKDSPIFMAGHRGMVGSAICHYLRKHGFSNLVTRSRAELDLTDQPAVRQFFKDNRIDHVVLAAARVGGIQANNIYPAEFIYQNLMIESNVIHQAFRAGVEHLLFLGSSCIYPKHAPQPMQEEYLLSGYLEPTNEPYAVAKIAGIKLCESYNRQYGTDYRAVMPTNLYGPRDNFDLENSHVLPALIRKYHLAKLAAGGNWGLIQQDESKYGPIPADLRNVLKSTSTAENTGALRDGSTVRLWGSGRPRREFLHVEDLASASLMVMALTRQQYQQMCHGPTDRTDEPAAEHNGSSAPARPSALHINVGAGKDVAIRELAAIIKSAVGYRGKEIWDRTQPDGTPQKLLDISKLKKIGWHPRVDLKDGIQRTYDWYLRRSAEQLPHRSQPV